MKYWMVRLALTIGQYEKQAYHLLRAPSEDVACLLALTDECHDKPEWLNDSNATEGCWDMGEMIYKIDGVDELTLDEFNIISKHM